MLLQLNEFDIIVVTPRGLSQTLYDFLRQLPFEEHKPLCGDLPYENKYAPVRSANGALSSTAFLHFEKVG